METARPAGTTKKPWYKSGKNWAIIGGVIVVLGIIGSLMPKDDTAPTGTPGATTQAPTSAAPKAAEKSTPAPKPTKTVSKAEQVETWWMQGRGILTAQYIKSLKSLKDAAGSNDTSTMLAECSQIIEWTKITGQNSFYNVDSLSDIDEDLDSTLGEARAAMKSLGKNCKAVFDDGKLTKATELGQDLGTALNALEIVKAGTYDKYMAG